MKSFSERYGYTEEKGIQFESLDKGTRTRLLNVFFEVLNSSFLSAIGDEFFKKSINHHPNEYSKMIAVFFEKNAWHEVFTLVEYIIQLGYKTQPLLISYENYKNLIDSINYVLTYEKSGYRCLDNIIVPITNEEELMSLQKSTSSKYYAVNIHFKKALSLYANRESPDYSNSIKESISAVESISKIIVGNDNATLSSALDRLDAKGVKIHKALRDGFKNLYGYTSDENGIRHAGIDFKNASEEDAKYMLISCSSFVNYLIQKYES